MRKLVCVVLVLIPLALLAQSSRVLFAPWTQNSPFVASVSGLPPTNIFVRNAGNPIARPGGLGAFFPENAVFDSVSGNFVLCGSGTSTKQGVVLYTNNVDPKDPTLWGYNSNPINRDGSVSPCLLKWAVNGTWYLFIGYGTSESNIVVYSNSVPYNFTDVNPLPVIRTNGSAVGHRVLEPYVFQDAVNTNLLRMLYMYDTGGPSEQVYYATATHPEGPWTNFASNPFIAFGAVNTYDHGTVADPWRYNWGGRDYIGYGSGYANVSPWQTAYGYTAQSDWATFTKVGLLVMTNGVAGAWDLTGGANDFRGAVGLDTMKSNSREYFLPITGDNFEGGVLNSPADLNAPILTPGPIFNQTNANTANLTYYTDINSWGVIQYGTAPGTYTVTIPEYTLASNFVHSINVTNLAVAQKIYTISKFTNILSTAGASLAETNFLSRTFVQGANANASATTCTTTLGATTAATNLTVLGILDTSASETISSIANNGSAVSWTKITNLLYTTTGAKQLFLYYATNGGFSTVTPTFSGSALKICYLSEFKGTVLTLPVDVVAVGTNTTTLATQTVTVGPVTTSQPREIAIEFAVRSGGSGPTVALPWFSDTTDGNAILADYVQQYGASINGTFTIGGGPTVDWGGIIATFKTQ
jgi:hypothetical protein